MEFVWLFKGNGNAPLPSAAFGSKAEAVKWIGEHGLSGVFTKYPVGVPLYQWAIQNGYFAPRNELQRNARAIANFSSAYLEHYHFENGEYSPTRTRAGLLLLTASRSHYADNQASSPHTLGVRRKSRILARFSATNAIASIHLGRIQSVFSGQCCGFGAA